MLENLDEIIPAPIVNSGNSSSSNLNEGDRNHPLKTDVSPHNPFGVFKLAGERAGERERESEEQGWWLREQEHASERASERLGERERKTRRERERH